MHINVGNNAVLNTTLQPQFE